MLDKRIRLYFIPLLIVLMFCFGCASNYYITAYNLQNRGNYIAAIENYDLYIERSSNGAHITQALLNRSEAYYELGLLAFERNNLRLALRYFYLANNPQADDKLLNSYLNIINAIDLEENFESAFALTSNVVNTFISVPSVAKLIYRRLTIIHENPEKYEKILQAGTQDIDVNQEFEEMTDSLEDMQTDTEEFLPHHQAIFNDYELLVEKDRERKFVEQALPILDQYMPLYVAEALQHPVSKTDVAAGTRPGENSEEWGVSIERLRKLLNYTVSHTGTIRTEIGSLYLNIGDDKRANEKYVDAEFNYLLALEYDPTLHRQIQERLNQTVNQMIAHGDALINERKIEQALEIYRQSFQIIPDNPAAQNAIARALEVKRKIEEAAELFLRGQQLENEERYEQALRVYRQSYDKDNLQRTADKIFLMTNLIEIERSPEDFARKIITEYRNGLIVRNLNRKAAEIREELNEEVNVSGWRVMLSTGANRYEIRYDITSRSRSLYYIWQVNLLNRQLTPLNAISSEIMGL